MRIKEFIGSTEQQEELENITKSDVFIAPRKCRFAELEHIRNDAFIRRMVDPLELAFHNDQESSIWTKDFPLVSDEEYEDFYAYLDGILATSHYLLSQDKKLLYCWDLEILAEPIRENIFDWRDDAIAELSHVAPKRDLPKDNLLVIDEVDFKRYKNQPVIDVCNQNNFSFKVISAPKQNLENELRQLHREATARVWVARSHSDDPKIIKKVERRKIKYNIKDEDIDAYFMLYWEGVMAVCRYLLDDMEFFEKDEYLAPQGSGLLDT